MSDPNDGMARFWEDLMNCSYPLDGPPKPVSSPTWPACCPVCRGMDRLTTVNLESGGSINAACFACDGTGKVTMQAERKAV